MFFRIRARYPDRPLLHHRDVGNAAVVLPYAPDNITDCVIAAAYLLDYADNAGRDHDLVQKGVRLLHGTQNVAGVHAVARMRSRREFPSFFSVKRRKLNAARNCGASERAHLKKRPLNPVIDVVEKAGAELYRQRRTRGNDFGAGADSRRLLIHLYVCSVTGHCQYLADKTLLADTHNVGYIRVLQPFGYDKRT